MSTEEPGYNKNTDIMNAYNSKRELIIQSVSPTVFFIASLHNESFGYSKLSDIKNTIIRSKQLVSHIMIHGYSELQIQRTCTYFQYVRTNDDVLIKQNLYSSSVLLSLLNR